MLAEIPSHLRARRCLIVHDQDTHGRPDLTSARPPRRHRRAARPQRRSSGDESDPAIARRNGIVALTRTPSAIARLEPMRVAVKQTKPVACRRQPDTAREHVDASRRTRTVVAHAQRQRRADALDADLDRAAARVRHVAVADRVLHERLQQERRNERIDVSGSATTLTRSRLPNRATMSPR